MAHTTQIDRRRQHGWSGTIAEFLAVPHKDFQNSLIDHVRQLFAHKETEKLEEILASQVRAWNDEYQHLYTAFSTLTKEQPHTSNWGVIFEYELPQEGGRRPDVIVLAGNTVVVLEFKMKNHPTEGDLDQLDGYVRDLTDLHSIAQTSHHITGRVVVTRSNSNKQIINDEIITPEAINSYLLSEATKGSIAIHAWLDATYSPSPGLIANALSNWTLAPNSLKTVEASNVPQAEAALTHIITSASQHTGNTRHVCFLTGTPGAGKTFVGLNLVHRTDIDARMRFLSGNKPLVEILNYALKQRQYLIKKIHEYRGEYNNNNPPENVLVFDEAQRALDSPKMYDVFKTRNTEPYEMLDIVARMDKWGVLVLLVGNGQEIYNGEAGLELWFAELAQRFQDHNWVLHMHPDHIPTVTAPFATNTIPEKTNWSDHLPTNVTITSNTNLHLTTSLRAHRAGQFHKWVNAVLDAKIEEAEHLAHDVRQNLYGLYVTRNLDTARQYLRDRYLGSPSARYGIVMASRNEQHASRAGLTIVGKKNQRGVRTPEEPQMWYVKDQDHHRSCCQLKTVATEFECQGLDLDSTILFWTDDLKWDPQTASWDVRPVQTSNPPLPDPRQTRINVYRVLLTRGRDSLVIYLPQTPDLDPTYEVLLRSGLAPLTP